jgi:hypothetical protein
MRMTYLLAVCMVVVSLFLETGMAAGAQKKGAPKEATSQQYFPDTLNVDYFSNANTPAFPDGTLRIINAGETETAGQIQGGLICADIYVFDTFQQMQECCGCPLSANGIGTLSVNNNLTNNPLTGRVLTNGVIQIVSATPATNGSCDPTNITPIPTLRAWVTHIESTATSSVGESQDVPLSAGAEANLAQTCLLVQTLGSGFGLCTCGT